MPVHFCRSHTNLTEFALQQGAKTRQSVRWFYFDFLLEVQVQCSRPTGSRSGQVSNACLYGALQLKKHKLNPHTDVCHQCFSLNTLSCITRTHWRVFVSVVCTWCREARHWSPGQRRLALLRSMRPT